MKPGVVGLGFGVGSRPRRVCSAAARSPFPPAGGPGSSPIPLGPEALPDLRSAAPPPRRSAAPGGAAGAAPAGRVHGSRSAGRRQEPPAPTEVLAPASRVWGPAIFGFGPLQRAGHYRSLLDTGGTDPAARGRPPWLREADRSWPGRYCGSGCSWRLCRRCRAGGGAWGQGPQSPGSGADSYRPQRAAEHQWRFGLEAAAPVPLPEMERSPGWRQAPPALGRGAGNWGGWKGRSVGGFPDRSLRFHRQPQPSPPAAQPGPETTATPRPAALRLLGKARTSPAGRARPNRLPGALPGPQHVVDQAHLTTIRDRGRLVSRAARRTWRVLHSLATFAENGQQGFVGTGYSPARGPRLAR